MTRIRPLAVAVLLAASTYGMVRGAMPAVQSGSWSPAGPMAVERAGAASALLPSGAILITGGSSATGALVSADLFGGDGAFSPVAPMSTARTDHTAVVLDDGRVLVVGGRGSDGAVAAAEIYLAGSWVPAGGLNDARWGHTATLMKDGRVLVAGGENALGNVASVEVFDPATGGWSVAGTLASPRTGHAAAALTDGRVLIAGGFDGVQVLSSIEVFDSASGALNILPLSLSVARAGLSATRLLNGSILFFGGNNGTADFASGELLDPEASMMSATPSAVVARRDHQAFLLPNNNAVLIVGGVTAAGGTASAELYLPWLNQFWATGAMGELRQDATGSALSLESYGPPSTSDGLLVVAGGQGLSSTDVYGFATIKTDRDDYVPGMAVNVSGGGWQPNETVTLGLRELPAEHETRSFAFQADEHGNIPISELFVVEQHHFGVQFYLTARGAASQAQVTFADARLWTLTITPTTTQTSATHTYTLTATNTSSAAPPNGNSELGCVTVTVPSSFTMATPAGLAINSAPVGKDWSIARVGQVITVDADANGEELAPGEAIQFSIDAVAPASAAGSPFEWVGTATANRNCSGGGFPAPTGGQPSVTVTTNTQPIVTLNGANSANEGQLNSYTYSTNDQDAAETFSLVSASCGANGTISNSLFAPATGAGSFDCTFPDGPASSIVSVEVSDGDASDTDSKTVTIGNVAPTVAFTAGPTIVSEHGVTEHTYTYSITDPGVDTVQVVSTSCGTDGTKVALSDTNDNGSGSFRCIFPDGQATPTVTASATDSDGATGAVATRPVTVNNVAPTISLTGADSVNEGSSYTLTLGNVVDPGTDTVASYVINWGDSAETFSGSPNGLSKTHTYADGPNSYNITVNLVDEDGTHAAADSKAVTVANVAPTVSFTGVPATTANEGETKTYAFSVSDPGNDTYALSATFPSCGTSGTLVVGSFSTTGNTGSQTGSFQCKFTDGPASSDVNIQFTDSDGAASNTATVSVTIANVAPTVSFTTAPDEANEGDVKTYAFSVNDPGDDTYTASAGFPSCGANGTPVGALSVTGNSGTQTGNFQCKFTDGPSTSNVSIQFTDSDLAAGNTATVAVTVANVAPLVSYTTAAALANEGATKTYEFSVVDAGDDTYTVTAGFPGCGTGGTLVPGSFTTTGNSGTQTGSFQCAFADGPANPTVSIQFTDSDNFAGDSATVSVAVANVAPMVSYTIAPTSAFEGETKSYTFSVTDPGQDIYAPSSGFPSCGTGGALVALSFNVSGTAGTQTGSFQCTFPDGPAIPDVRIQFTDSDGAGGNIAGVSVSVQNVSPLVNTPVVAPEPSSEGSSATASAAFSDPSVNDAPFTCTVNYGDGSGPQPGNILAGTCTGPAHTYADNQSFTVTITVTDKDGGSGSNTITHVVTNVPPVLNSLTASAFTAPIGTLISLDANYSDVGAADTHTCYINWDDGMPLDSAIGIKDANPTVGSCAPSRLFNTQGVYSITVYVKDDDGGKSNELTLMVTIFDPDGGFVTGGGWIMSPPGAYVLDEDLVGKANFGFVSKYKKGSQTPEGQTEFQFKAGDLNFHSSAYDLGSLVVSDFKAQYKGTGTINGQPGYKFILTAYDGNIQGGGGVDRFRMKIIRLSDNSLVYDNARGSSDDIDAANPLAIGGGSIVIHDNKKK